MTDVAITTASVDDVAAVCTFGARVVPPHYAPLIGDEAAQGQVEQYWTADRIGAAAADERVFLARDGTTIVGVAELGTYDGAWVIWKLYVDPQFRGAGIGPRLIAAASRRLPATVAELHIEHIAVNERAGSFYEREGFFVRAVEPHSGGDDARATVWRVRPRAVPRRADVDRLLAATRYLVLGTADAAGNPWVSPVFFALLGTDAVCWVSGPDRRHSRNIADRPAVALTVFDSTVAVGGAEAVFADTEARTARADEIAPALAAMNARLPAGRHMDEDDLQPVGPLVVYVAEVRHWYLLVRGGNPEFGNHLDMTIEI